MLNRILGRLFNRWPSGVPHLYPGLDARTLAAFMTEQEFLRIRSFDCVYILPFADSDSSGQDLAFGLGLSHLMIRNLMLLTDLSIRGPEDTPKILRDNVVELSIQREAVFVTGTATRSQNRYQLDFDVQHRGASIGGDAIDSRSWPQFLKQTSESIARSIGSRGAISVNGGWDSGQAETDMVLEQYGALAMAFSQKETMLRTNAAIQMMQKYADFALPAWLIDNEAKAALKWNLEGLRRDPLNAQICFELFCALSHITCLDPAGVQFCRKAIELSPGHGKSHMCAPHRAPRSVNMLNHSELGYRLLAGNPFAINNYILNLKKHKAPPERLLEFAKEGIRSDPEDPGNYMRMIELLSDMKEWQAALDVANSLLQLYHPVMSERALYCLRQVPQIAAMLDAGTFDPVSQATNTVAQLTKKVRSP